MEVYVLTFII